MKKTFLFLAAALFCLTLGAPQQPLAWGNAAPQGSVQTPPPPPPAPSAKAPRPAAPRPYAAPQTGRPVPPPAASGYGKPVPPAPAGAGYGRPGPSDYRPAPRTAAPAPDHRQPAFAGGPIRANVETKVYHQPSCRYYSAKNCTATFSSAREADSRGFRPCKKCFR